jgi:hypothetical protein
MNVQRKRAVAGYLPVVKELTDVVPFRDLSASERLWTEYWLYVVDADGREIGFDRRPATIPTLCVRVVRLFCGTIEITATYNAVLETGKKLEILQVRPRGRAWQWLAEIEPSTYWCRDLRPAEVGP